ncbi:MAG: crotonase/enoyl-CoA hydratase family protein [Deltaproteobacteria bacterium]|nr:MAG: crotonase/enoyl-CoA hydratase family protein [Deltaproteobacteria bacterium]
MSRVTLERHDSGVVHLVLDHPSRHNAIDWEMMVELKQAMTRLRKDRSLRAVVVRGNGPSFCSGLNFPSMSKRPARLVQGFVTPPHRATNLFQESCWGLRSLPVPVIAVLHGRCYGGGIQIALAADFRFTTPDCELSIMESKWGLIPDMSGTVALRELVGIDQAKLLTMTGRILDGRAAHAIGLVTGVAEDPLAEAEALVAELLTRSPDSTAAAKALLQANWVDDESSALARERRIQMLVMASKNFREALRANFKKVAPRFGKRSPLL